MRPLKRICCATSLSLSLTLSLPCPVSAAHPELAEGERPPGRLSLRPQPDLAGLEEALHPELESPPKSRSGVRMADGKQGDFIRVPDAGVRIRWLELMGGRAAGGYRFVAGAGLEEAGEFLKPLYWRIDLGLRLVETGGRELLKKLLDELEPLAQLSGSPPKVFLFRVQTGDP